MRRGFTMSCSPVSSADAKPGDLVFFVGTYDTPGVSHVGIYVGDNVMLHCGDPIQYTSINTSYWQSHFYAFGRTQLLTERSVFMNPKYQKVCAEIAKTEKKVEDLQGQLKELYDKKTELENLEIVNTVRAMVMDKDQIMVFLAAMKDGKVEKSTITQQGGDGQ